MVQGPFSSSPVTRWTYDLLNAGFLQMGNKADRPLASTANRMMYLAEDTGEILYSQTVPIRVTTLVMVGVLLLLLTLLLVMPAGLRTLGFGARQGAAGSHGHSLVATSGDSRYSNIWDCTVTSQRISVLFIDNSSQDSVVATSGSLHTMDSRRLTTMATNRYIVCCLVQVGLSGQVRAGQ